VGSPVAVGPVAECLVCLFQGLGFGEFPVGLRYGEVTPRRCLLLAEWPLDPAKSGPDKLLLPVELARREFRPVVTGPVSRPLMLNLRRAESSKGLEEIGTESGLPPESFQDRRNGTVIGVSSGLVEVSFCFSSSGLAVFSEVDVPNRESLYSDSSVGFDSPAIFEMLARCWSS